MDRIPYWPDPVRDHEHEAIKLLDLIVAEFKSDPASVVCFDARIVERAKECVEQRKRWERSGKLPPLLTESKYPCPDCGSMAHFEC